MNDTLRTLCNRLDIEYRSSHKLRKTFVSSLIDEGVNINTVREVAGHAAEQTTMQYYCYDRKSKTERDAQILSALNGRLH